MHDGRSISMQINLKLSWTTQFPSLMVGYKESFPNSEQLLRCAFSLSDPTPELLQLIKAYPTVDAVREPLIFYIEAVEANPCICIGICVGGSPRLLRRTRYSG